jgi:hypothetical protein
MADTTLWASGTTRGPGWTIEEQGGDDRIGEIRQSGKGFIIVPEPGSILTGIAPGPYATREAAMLAIANHTNGRCRLGRFPH